MNAGTIWLSLCLLLVSSCGANGSGEATYVYCDAENGVDDLWLEFKSGSVSVSYYQFGSYDSICNGDWDSEKEKRLDPVYFCSVSDDQIHYGWRTNWSEGTKCGDFTSEGIHINYQMRINRLTGVGYGRTETCISNAVSELSGVVAFNCEVAETKF